MNIEKIIKITLITLLLIYTWKLRNENINLSKALKKIGKSANACNIDKYKCMHQIDKENLRYNSIIVINAITISTSVYIMSGYLNEKCTFDVLTMKKINILNYYHDIGDYDKVIGLIKQYNLNPAEGMIPYQKLVNIFNDM